MTEQENVKRYCINNGITVAAFERKCDLANGIVRAWEKQGTVPSMRTLKKIENATGIPVQNWITEGGV